MEAAEKPKVCTMDFNANHVVTVINQVSKIAKIGQMHQCSQPQTAVIKIQDPFKGWRSCFLMFVEPIHAFV